MEDLPVNTYFWEHADGSWMIGDAQWCFTSTPLPPERV